MVSYKVYYITICLIALFSILFFLFATYFNSSKRKIKVLKKSSIIYYEKIVALFKSIHNQIEKIKELNILIEKNAEINPQVINTNDYKSSDYLIVLRETYLRQLLLDDALLCDTYNSICNHLPQGAQNVLVSEIILIHKFIKKQIDDCDFKLD